MAKKKKKMEDEMPKDEKKGDFGTMLPGKKGGKKGGKKRGRKGANRY